MLPSTERFHSQYMRHGNSYQQPPVPAITTATAAAAAAAAGT
jgi:hypothetical protein